eukprot:65724-Alexandrium_andersonii.AAC.1
MAINVDMLGGCGRGNEHDRAHGCVAIWRVWQRACGVRCAVLLATVQMLRAARARVCGWQELRGCRPAMRRSTRATYDTPTDANATPRTLRKCSAQVLRECLRVHPDEVPIRNKCRTGDLR